MVDDESPMNILPKDRSPLLPDRHPTSDFFVCDIFDAAAARRGDMASMGKYEGHPSPLQGG